MTLNVLDYSPRLWLDASVGSSLVLDVNEKVGTWNDLSGSGKHFTSVNAVGSLRPAVVERGVFFEQLGDGSTANAIQTACSMMQNTSGSLITPTCVVFAVISQAVGTYFPQGIFFGWSGNTVYSGFGARGLWSRNGNMSFTNQYTIANPEITNIISWELTAVDHRGWLNGDYLGQRATSLSGSYSITYLGAERLATWIYPNSPFKGVMHEVIVCGLLEPSARLEIEEYLMDKWFTAYTGTVYEWAGGQPVPGAYPVYVYDRANGKLVGSTMSALDGTYYIRHIPGLEHYIMAIDNSAPIQRSAIVDKVVPS